MRQKLTHSEKRIVHLQYAADEARKAAKNLEQIANDIFATCDDYKRDIKKLNCGNSLGIVENDTRQAVDSEAGAPTMSFTI